MLIPLDFILNPNINYNDVNTSRSDELTAGKIQLQKKKTVMLITFEAISTR